MDTTSEDTKQDVAMAVDRVVNNDLDTALAQLKLRAMQDLAWQQMTCDLLESFEKCASNPEATTRNHLLLEKMMQHLHDDVVVLKKALEACATFVQDLKDHENMKKRAQLEKERKRLARQMQKRELALEQTQALE